MRKPNPYKFRNKQERREDLEAQRYDELDKLFDLTELDLSFHHYTHKRYKPTRFYIKHFRHCMCRYYRMWLNGESNGVKISIRIHVRFLANRLEYSIVATFPKDIGNYAYDAKDVTDSSEFLQALVGMGYQPAVSVLRKRTIDNILLDL